jgi:hypothetical protein
VAPHEQDETGAGEHLEPVEVRIPTPGAHDMHGGINGHTSSEVAEPMQYRPLVEQPIRLSRDDDVPGNTGNGFL